MVKDENLENEEYEMGYVELVDQDGNEKKLYIEDDFDYEDKRYLILCESSESEDSYLFYVESMESEEDIVIREVEDDEEFERVSEFYYNS